VKKNFDEGGKQRARRQQKWRSLWKTTEKPGATARPRGAGHHEPLRGGGREVEEEDPLCKATLRLDEKRTTRQTKLRKKSKSLRTGDVRSGGMLQN